ncbi:MAG: hypothetical protein V4712_07455 [Pseudomonadota bacterium]
MTKTMFALSLGLAGVLLATQAAQAAPQCGPRDAVLATLADKYRETRQGIGIASNNSVMELFASAASGTWTITVTMPDGAMCLVASGEGFEAVAEDLPAKGQPA